MKIYTKTGDRGETGQIHGRQIEEANTVTVLFPY
jgi:cob(I)alamin adenosyltransferase